MLKLDAYFADANIRELIDAAFAGNAAKVDQLIREGADVNTVGREDMTPLMWALGKQNKQAMVILLARGANPNFRATDRLASTVTLAAGAEDPEFLRILLENGGDPNLGDAQKPAIFYAISFDREDNLKLLLDAGANPNLPGPVGETPIMHCVVHNAFHLGLILLKRGADIRATDNMGYSVAHVVQRKKLQPGTAYYDSLQELKKALEARGVTFPVANPPSPLEQWRKQQKQQ